MCPPGPANDNTSIGLESGCRVQYRLTTLALGAHTIHMKRTNLVLDESILDEAHRLGGERTLSRTVERALAEFVRRAKARKILDLVGTGAWQGDLPLMREDQPVYGKRRRGSR